MSKLEAIQSKVDLLKLAKKICNVSKACEIMNYSRDSYYRFKKLYDKSGRKGLQRISRRDKYKNNRVAKNIKKAVIKIATHAPLLGQLQVSEMLTAAGYKVSPGGVRSIWLCHNLNTLKKPGCQSQALDFASAIFKIFLFFENGKFFYFVKLCVI